MLVWLSLKICDFRFANLRYVCGKVRLLVRFRVTQPINLWGAFKNRPNLNTDTVKKEDDANSTYTHEIIYFNVTELKWMCKEFKQMRCGFAYFRKFSAATTQKNTHIHAWSYIKRIKMSGNFSFTLDICLFLWKKKKNELNSSRLTNGLWAYF